jgi:uncharacterized membrane protein YebE (DUF533 family)
MKITNILLLIIVLAVGYLAYTQWQDRTEAHRKEVCSQDWTGHPECADNDLQRKGY